MDSTPHCSRVVPHPSTERAQTALTSVFGWEPVHYGWYGRIHTLQISIRARGHCVSKDTDLEESCDDWSSINAGGRGFIRLASYLFCAKYWKKKFRGHNGDWTHDQWLIRPTLYRLSYAPIHMQFWAILTKICFSGLWMWEARTWIDRILIFSDSTILIVMHRFSSEHRS